MKGLVLVVLAITVVILLTVNALAVKYLEDLERPREDTWSSSSYGDLIFIEGNDGLAVSTAVKSGSGLEEDPFTIQGLGVSIYDFYPEIYGGDMTGFEIRNTSAHLVIKESSVGDLGCGMKLSNVSNCAIERTFQSNTEIAYNLVNCTNCRISAFEVSGCGVLFRLENSSNITITGGRLHWGTTVTEVWNCDNVTVFHNDFMDYSDPGYSLYGSDNAWDAGYPEGGNFWGRYYGEDHRSGHDQNHWLSDGLGDEPYNITGVVDRYPLMDEQFYSAIQGRVDRAAAMFPLALIANIMLVPALILLVPKSKISLRFPRPRDITLVVALALCSPGVVSYAIKWTENHTDVLLPQLELAMFASMAAYIGFLSRDTEWKGRAGLSSLVKFGFMASFVPIVILIAWTAYYSIRLADQTSTYLYAAYTAGTFAAAGALAWYMARMRRHPSSDSSGMREFWTRSTAAIFYSLATATQVSLVFLGGLLGGYSLDAIDASLSFVAIAVPASAGLLILLTFVCDRGGGTFMRAARLSGCLLLLAFCVVAIVQGLFPTMGT